VHKFGNKIECNNMHVERIKALYVVGSQVACHTSITVLDPQWVWLPYYVVSCSVLLFAVGATAPSGPGPPCLRAF